LSSITKNKYLESTTHFKIIDKGHVKDTLLLITAKPYKYRGKKYSLVKVENLRSNELADSTDTQEGFYGIVGQNEKMQELFETIRQIRSSNDPVLLQGESGTGKELVAMAIHRESVRAARHFVPVNCGALPEGLLESEMFGHIKGAFTGANFNKKGRFKVADRGTIFLDEVSELNPSMQAKFLRVIETGCYEPVGSDQQITVDARVISATNSLLEKEIEKGRFRSDLYYRLCVIPILLPALRERRDDIPLLSEFSLKKFALKKNQKKLKLSKEALSVLENYSWPGNVRELQNVLKYAVLKCQRELITPEHFPYYLFQNKINYVTRRRRKLKLDVAKVSDALRQTKGNKRWAAEKLGVSRSTLYRFFDKQET
jgi:transcriptional regulator with PAS, ATPase and Fis domain